MPRYLRYLRIAFSAVCGIACALLVVLWVRSYSTLDNIAGHLPFNPGVSSTSAYGRVALGSLNARPRWDWKYHNAVLDEQSYGGRPKEPRRWFIFQRTPIMTSMGVPHGFLVFIATVFAIVPWIPRRFSLRTLLIATTLIAVVLGLVVWSTR